MLRPYRTLDLWGKVEINKLARYSPSCMATGAIPGKGFSALIANGVATRVENIFDPFDTLEDYEELFPILPKPTSIKTWQSNTGFAYQRLAGANPLVIRGISSLPDNFPVSDAIFQKAMGPDKTIDSEAAKGNL